MSRECCPPQTQLHLREELLRLSAGLWEKREESGREGDRIEQMRAGKIGKKESGGMKESREVEREP